VKARITCAAVRTFRKVSNSSRRSCTSILGSLVTTPEGSRTRPAGSCKAKSPRSAFAISPVVIRLLIVCNSSSEIVPFKPSSRRPLGVPGS